MKYLLLILPLAACAPHVERCLSFPLPQECTQEGGGGLSLLAGGDVPPKPEPPAPPGPEPEPPHPKPDHDDDDDDRGDHDDDERDDDDREHDDD